MGPIFKPIKHPADVTRPANDSHTFFTKEGPAHAAPANTIQAKGKKKLPLTPASHTVTLNGVYGNYTVVYGLLSPGGSGKRPQYFCTITMQPNEKTKGNRIAFVQLARRGTMANKWSVGKDDPNMNEEKAARTTPEGWRVDRINPAEDKVPFMNSWLDNTGKLRTTDNATIAGFGDSEQPRMTDTPELLDPGKMQFVSTAMDIHTGATFDSIAWGAELDSAAGIFKDGSPGLVDAEADRTAAYKKWNTQANDKNKMEKIPGVKP